MFRVPLPAKLIFDIVVFLVQATDLGDIGMKTTRSIFRLLHWRLCFVSRMCSLALDSFRNEFRKSFALLSKPIICVQFQSVSFENVVSHFQMVGHDSNCLMHFACMLYCIFLFLFVTCGFLSSAQLRQVSDIYSMWLNVVRRIRTLAKLQFVKSARINWSLYFEELHSVTQRIIITIRLAHMCSEIMCRRKSRATAFIRNANAKTFVQAFQCVVLIIIKGLGFRV